MILGIYGDGKGKTTSAIGTMLRTINLNIPTALVLLFKNPDKFPSNEISFLQQKDIKSLKIRYFPVQNWIDFKKPTVELFKVGQGAIQYTQRMISRKFHFILLDEFLLAEYYNIISTKDLIDLINQANQEKTDLFLTGRKFNPKLKKYFDLLSEVKNIKHPFDKGEKSREGIDY